MSSSEENLVSRDLRLFSELLNLDCWEIAEHMLKEIMLSKTYLHSERGKVNWESAMTSSHTHNNSLSVLD